MGVAALVATVGLAGCSGGPEVAATSPAPAPAGPASDAAPTASAAPASPGPVATLATEACLSGRYRLVRFVAAGASSTYGTGQGGDVTVAFDDGRYTLTGAGREPVVVTLGGQTGELVVDGSSTGTYARQDSVATFTPRSATGGGTLRAGSGGPAQQLTMAQVDNVLGLTGDGRVACTAQAMTLTLAAVRLELART